MMRIRPWGLGGLIVWLCLSVATARERANEWGLDPMWGFWGVWGIGMLLVMLVFWSVVIVGIVLAIRWLATQGREPRSTDAALESLRQRYARGDVGTEEFDARKRDLT